MGFLPYLESARQSIDAAVEGLLPPVGGPTDTLARAMRHSVAGGKRLRAATVMLAADTFGLEPDKVLPTACAVEFYHAGTLIHDDLPCIDDDDLRRGRPTCHKAFGEAPALLAGDALFLLCLETIASQAATPVRRLLWRPCRTSLRTPA